MLSVARMDRRKPASAKSFFLIASGVVRKPEVDVVARAGRAQKIDPQRKRLGDGPVVDPGIYVKN